MNYTMVFMFTFHATTYTHTLITSNPPLTDSTRYMRYKIIYSPTVHSSSTGSAVSSTQRHPPAAATRSSYVSPA